MTELKQLAKLRHFRKGMDLNEFMSTEFRQNMQSIEKSLNDETAPDGFSYSGTTGSQVTSSGNVIVYNGQELDRKSLYNPVTGIFKPDRDGFYDFEARGLLTVNISTTQSFFIYLTVNNIVKCYGHIAIGNGVSVVRSSYLSRKNLYLVKGDEVSILGYSDVSANISTLTEHCYFNARFVGI